MLNCLLGLISGFFIWLYLVNEALRRARKLEEARRKVAVPPEEEEKPPPPPPEEVAPEGVEAYCMRCRARRVMVNPRRVILKNKRPAMRGTCPVCGGSMFRFIKA